VSDHGGGRLTMLASDGVSIAALVVGEPLHLLSSPSGVTIASEPHDGDPGWRELADGAAVHVTPDGLAETSL
jgi:glutamine amidotransferase